MLTTGVIILLCLFMDFVTTKFLTRTQPLSESHKIERLLKAESPTEVPIFGNSRAELGYYTPAIGSDVYNYGFPNQSFDVIQFLLQLELNSDRKTPILIDVHHGFFEHDPQSNINISTYLPYLQSNKTVRQFIADQNRMQPYYLIPGMRYFGSYNDYVQPLIETSSTPQKNIHIRGGIYTNAGFSMAATARRIDKKKDKVLHFTADAEKDSLLRSIIAQHPDRTFIFSLSPYHSSAQQTLDNASELTAYFEALDSSFEQVIFVSAANEYPDSYFKDTIHLNKKGAEAFSKALRKQLSERGIEL